MMREPYIESAEPAEKEPKHKKRLRWFGSQRPAKPASKQPTPPAGAGAAPAVQREQQSGGKISAFARDIYTWQWTKRLLLWIIVSAGTMSELAFLVASVWMSLNANVHPFFIHTLGMSQTLTDNITYLATTAYVALPECIVTLAVMTTIGHIRMVVYNPRDFWPWIWSVLNGLPAVFFLVLSMLTLSNAVANVTFTMPTTWVVVRANAAFIYAFSCLLYLWMGKDQEKDRLVKKDAEITELTKDRDAKLAQLATEHAAKMGELERITGAKIAELTGENRRLNEVIQRLNQDLGEQIKQHSELVNALNESSKSALGAYSQECISWLMSGVKSVSVEEITAFTGHSKRKIHNAIGRGEFRHPGRNKGLILVSSLVEWLEKNPPEPAQSEKNTGPILRIVNE